ncbi:MAG: enoyl-CoA hydratase [Polyangiaceae bacterium]|nr:enoyl-CoA hydratase [Polyangiaceae bacterium]
MIERPYKVITAAVDGSRAVLTMNNPSRKNAIGPRMMNELLWAFEDAHADDAVRSIVLTGAGDAFCAGGDFTEMAAGPGEEELLRKGDFVDLLLAIVRSTKPVVARVNGVAMGGGIGLVAACHFAIAADNAKFGTPEINVGLFPMMIMAVLERVVPKRKLTEMMLLGERMTAHEAMVAGIVGHVVPAVELDHAVRALTDKIAAKSPLTIKLGLEAYRAQEDMELAKALPMLRDKLGECLATDDAREGLMAFLEKRAPVWTGK